MIDPSWMRGLVVLAADRSVIFATERALALLGCTAAGCAAERLQPVLENLPDSGSARQTHDVGARSLAIDAHALPRPHGWLLEISQTEDPERLDAMVADSVRARLWGRLRPAMHHDFKAPIQSMLWSIEILEKSIAGADAEERRHASLGILRKEVASLQLRLQALLEDIAPMDYEASVIDAGELVQHAAHVTRSEAGLYGVDVDVVAPEEELFVEGRRGPLKEALLLVLFAALDHLREGGALKLSAEAQGETIGVRIDRQGRSPDAGGSSAPADTEPALRVAEQIVKAHGGTLERTPSATDTSLAIRLPRAKPRRART